MTIERLFGTLALVATLFVIAALWVIGTGTRPVGTLSNTISDFSSLGALLPTVPAAGSALDPKFLLAAFVSGWLAHWVYGLPWSAMPRAVLSWLLGWQTSVIMLVVAVGCMAVLLLY